MEPTAAEALSPGDSSSPSPGLDRLTPESSSSSDDLGKGPAMDPLLSTGDEDSSSDGDEVYELRDRASRAIDGRLRGGFAYTAEEERAVVDKFDRRLVLFVAFLYMLSFLDRSSSSHFSSTSLLIISLCPFCVVAPPPGILFLVPASSPQSQKCHSPIKYHSSSDLLGARKFGPQGNVGRSRTISKKIN
jgi:hypothetical protein